ADTLATPLKAAPGARPSTLRRLLGPEWQLGWALVAPVVIIVSALLIYPFFDAILLSFQERFIGKTGTWVGLANYADLFSSTSSPWVKALITTLVVTGGAIASKFLIGMSMACGPTPELPARNLFRGLLFLPWAVPRVV